MPAIDRSASSRQAEAINTHEGLSKGSKVWVRNVGSHAAWELGELRSTDGLTAQVLLDRTNKTVPVKLENMVAANPKLQDGIPDLTHLSYLNEPGILHNLDLRYAVDDIYTFAGPVLIAVNPCKPLPLYTSEVANMYKARARDVVQSANLAPHIYLVAANAFRRMLREKTSQSLIVNGESGAGKTETTKKAMQYFATLAGGTGVEDQVLETNPVLEAFGNAKTLRNHNSSRFGKLIQIHFNQGNHICGAAIKTYLLEKSRVVHQLKGERSYHIFYQLVRGATPEQRKALHLPEKPQGFKYLSNSGCTDIDGVDDAKEFKDVCHALGHIGIDPNQQGALFRLLSGIMWLGNLDFKLDPTNRANDAAKVVEDAACNAACDMLGVTAQAMNKALTTKKIVTPGEVITKVLNLQEARDCRDALAKALYAATFDWIVARINEKLDAGKSRQGSGLSIAILDIYGFEQFQTNSFEQLCINYANERLQQQFTRHLFTLEQQEYESEGIDWTKVEFIDNWECVDAIEATPPRGLGVLAVLDAQCKFPKATDDSFIQNLKESLGKHTHFEINPRRPTEFTVLHYAGSVSYSCMGFLDKNKDTLNFDLVELMLGADVEASPLVPQLGEGIKDELEANAKRGQTVGSRFSTQLRDLIAELDATGLHFVRCIKPNSKLQPALWEESMVLHQLRCCGVLEVARIARAGYPTRYTHQQFAERYAILLPRDQQRQLLASTSIKRGATAPDPASSLAACKQLLGIFGLDRELWQIGHTKIFFRPGALGFVEDKWASMQLSVLKIQATFRMYRARKVYHAHRNAAITFQAGYRSRADRFAYEELKRQTRAASLMQRMWRAHHALTRYQLQKASAIKIQKAWRQHRFNQRVQVRVAERKHREHLAYVEQNKFEALRTQYGCEMDDVRAALAAWHAAKEAGHGDLQQAMLAKQAERGIHPTGAAAAAGAAAVATADAPAGALSPRGELGSGGGSGLTAQGSQRGITTPREPVPDAAMLQHVGSIGGAAAAAAAIQAARFAAAQEHKDVTEKQALEIVRLTKQLQLERSLKDRYQHKYEEQNALWLEQIKVLQEYIQQVRQAFGDARLPPLPSALAAAGAYKLTGVNSDGPTSPRNAGDIQDQKQEEPGHRESATVATQVSARLDPATVAAAMSAMRDPAHDPSPFAAPAGRNSHDSNGVPPNGATLPRRGGGRVNGPLGATAYMMHGHDDDNSDGVPTGFARPSDELPRGFDRARRPPGLELQLPSDDSYPDFPDRGNVSPTDLISPSRPVVPVHGQNQLQRMQMQRAQPIQGRAAVQAAVDPRGGVANKYVTQLDGELAKVQQVLDDDVDFIGEVANGAVAVPSMDPAQELARLRKKFDLWRKEFKDKLTTAESVLKKLDRMSNVQTHAPPRQAQVLPGPHIGNGYPHYPVAPTPGAGPSRNDKAGGFGLGKLFKGK